MYSSFNKTRAETTMSTVNFYFVLSCLLLFQSINCQLLNQTSLQQHCDFDFNHDAETRKQTSKDESQDHIQLSKEANGSITVEDNQNQNKHMNFNKSSGTQEDETSNPMLQSIKDLVSNAVEKIKESTEQIGVMESKNGTLNKTEDWMWSMASKDESVMKLLKDYIKEVLADLCSKLEYFAGKLSNMTKQVEDTVYDTVDHYSDLLFNRTAIKH